jgi:beta-RFAP synthase
VAHCPEAATRGAKPGANNAGAGFLDQRDKLRSASKHRQRNAPWRRTMNQAFPGSQAGSERFAVRVEAPARLHLGFIDVSGSLGRRFGSLGLTLEDFSTVLSLRRAESFEASGPDAQRASDYLRRLLDDHDPPSSVALRVHQAIPEHVGLGSGTQLALAVGKAFGTLFELPVSALALAARLDRGARSGIGIGAFEEGGFVVDGGRSATGAHPPVISRMPFPGSWRVLLVFDRAERGLFGEAERAAFRALQAFPQQRAAHLAHLVLMRLMPALVEEDFASFGSAVGEIQRVVGDYFAAAQGGRFASAAVAQALGWLEARGIAGVGQTSWGPTGFAIVDSEVRAQALLREARERFSARSELGFAVARARNRGHRLEVLSEAQARDALRETLPDDSVEPKSRLSLGRR